MGDKTYELLEKLYLELQEVKEDMVTKEDLKGFATKEDLKFLATKEDLELLAEELHVEIQMVLNEVVELRKDLNTMEILTTKNAHDIAIIKAAR